MKYSDQNILTQACQELFETMFFTFVEPVDPQADPVTIPDGCLLHGKISLDSSLEEKLHFIAPKAMLKNMASILLHNDRPAEITEAELLDLTREITNIMLGKALRKANQDQTQRFAALTAESIRSTRDLRIGPDCDPTYFQTEWGTIMLVFERGHAGHTA